MTWMFVRERQGFRIFGNVVHLDDCEVGVNVSPYNLTTTPVALAETHLDLLGVGYDVLVRDYMSVEVVDEAGTLCGLGWRPADTYRDHRVYDLLIEIGVRIAVLVLDVLQGLPFGNLTLRRRHETLRRNARDEHDEKNHDSYERLP